MKYLKHNQIVWILVLFIAITTMLCSCHTYQSYIAVNSAYNIPNGTMSIVLAHEMDYVKAAFIKSGVMLKSLEGGFETEEILIDEGTRAMYKVHQFDDYVRVTAFWGVTDKVKSRMTVWAGYVAASSYDTHSWYKVTYDNTEARCKRVFDYAVQILNANQLEYQFR